MYKNIQTPNSPLSPLPPRIRSSEYLVEKSPNLQYLTPSYSSKTSHQSNKRRSFTPIEFDNIAPPSVSPIPTVFESPDSDYEYSAILKRPISSASKLSELLKTPPKLSRMTDQKSHSCSLSRNASNKMRRTYHCQRKYENRPKMINVDITSLRRSLLTSFLSPSISEENGKMIVTWNDSPMEYDYGKRGFNSKAKPSVPLNMVKEKVKKSVTWSDSSSRCIRANRDPNLKVKPLVPLINLYTPQKEYISPQNHENHNDSSLGNDSVLNNDLSIESVLKDIGMQKYIEKFLLEEIDLFVFFHLEPKDLYTLNIAEEDHETILQAIQMYDI